MSARRLLAASSGSHVDANGMITDSWDKFISNVKNGKAQQCYEIGNYIPLDLGDHGLLNMEIIAFNPPWPIADCSRVPNIALLSKELMNDDFTATFEYMMGVSPINWLAQYKETIFGMLPDWLKTKIEPCYRSSYCINTKTNSTDAGYDGSVYYYLTPVWTVSIADFYNGYCENYNALSMFATMGTIPYLMQGTKGQVSSNNSYSFVSGAFENLKKKKANGSSYVEWALSDYYYSRMKVISADGKFDYANAGLSTYPLPLGFCL